MTESGVRNDDRIALAVCSHFRDAEDIDKMGRFRTGMDGICLLRGHGIMRSVCDICRHYDPVQKTYWRPLL